MRFFYQRNDGSRRELGMDEVHEHLSKCQIADAIESKKEDPAEEVSYMTNGGFIIVEI